MPSLKKIDIDNLYPMKPIKSAVSEILNGKRPLHLNHIRKLAKKFHVKPASFV